MILSQLTQRGIQQKRNPETNDDICTFFDRCSQGSIRQRWYVLLENVTIIFRKEILWCIYSSTAAYPLCQASCRLNYLFKLYYRGR